MKSPPGRRVHWFIQALDGQRFIVKGTTAYEAAANCGLKLSQCKDNIDWEDIRESNARIAAEKAAEKLAESSAVGPECFPGSDEESHYVSNGVHGNSRISGRKKGSGNATR